jgi:hypothetical protein
MSPLTTCAACGAPLNHGITDVTNYPCEVCGSTTWNTRLTVVPIEVKLSPFAFQWYAKDFYGAYKKVKGGPPFSPARLTLLAQAVELAAKSLHVHQGKCDDELRKLGHNLVKACDATMLGLHGIPLTSSEETELKKLSDLNEAKAFQYFWFRYPPFTPELAGVMHAVSGRKGLPDERILEEFLIKLLAPKL